MSTVALPEAYGLALISMGHVMFMHSIPAHDAWSEEYKDQHIDYLRNNDVSNEVIGELMTHTAAELMRRC